MQFAQPLVKRLRGIKANEANRQLFPLYLHKSDVRFIIDFGNRFDTTERTRECPNLALANLAAVNKALYSEEINVPTPPIFTPTSKSA